MSPLGGAIRPRLPLERAGEAVYGGHSYARLIVYRPRMDTD